MVTELVCGRCVKSLSPDDTVGLVDDRLVHLDCGRPRDLSPQERVLLYMFCRDHSAASCAACRKSFQQQQLAADLFSNQTHLCPVCHADLLESLRAHLYACAAIPEEVRRRAREARDTAQRLVKRSHELTDRADVLIREAEAAVAALRDSMRRVIAGEETRP